MRYIDADILKDLYQPIDGKDYNVNMAVIRANIDDMPTTDVQEVRHGKWIAKKRGKYKDYLSVCSLCRHQILNDFIKESKYCPNCGAKMDGE